MHETFHLKFELMICLDLQLELSDNCGHLLILKCFSFFDSHLNTVQTFLFHKIIFILKSDDEFIKLTNLIFKRLNRLSSDTDLAQFLCQHVLAVFQLLELN